jgi:hypothetical protein
VRCAMNVKLAGARIQSSTDDEEAVVLPWSILSRLAIDDVAEGVSINVETEMGRQIDLD